ncbi:MAG: DUF1800 domain-containing protein [Lentimonas sp.]
MQAETVVLWQDDGNGKNVGEVFTTKYGLDAASVGTIVADPTDTTHGAVHSLNLRGTNGTSTEWGNLRINTSPYEVEDGMVWDNRIVPGETTYTFTAQFFIPDTTTMSGNDVVYLLLRFYSQNGQFSAGNHINAISRQYDAGDSGYWIHAEVEGIVPAVDEIGDPIAKVDVRVPCSDYLPNAGDDAFVFVDNVKLTVDIPATAPLPPHPVHLEPTRMDANLNGFPDVWEALYGAYGLDPNADGDHDGVSNGDEATSGTDPFDANSRVSLNMGMSASNEKELTWPELYLRPHVIETSTDLGVNDPWQEVTLATTLDEGERHATISDSALQRFYRASVLESDGDGDSIPDWIEGYLGFYIGSGGENSSSQSKSYDTTGDGSPDTTLSGDLASFNEIYQELDPAQQMTDAQAARFLIQTSFGPTYEDIQYLKMIGPTAWIKEQMSLPKTYTTPYILALKADLDAGVVDPELSEYAGMSDFVRGVNYPTAWARSTIAGQDQLRQRVAFALSQIVVCSRSAANLGNQPQATAHYYDQFVDEAFGNYEDLLNKVSRHPMMGHYLSSLGNQKADESIERYPDENFARELMQLFTIGLWELNLDGTRKLDLSGEPIPTYGNPEITELARVFTGVNYASSSFGGGWRDDGFYMTTPLMIFPDEHDFGAKTLVTGHVIPARTPSEANGLQDVEDVVYHLVRHDNTAPFVCRQLIQFLVTSNPSPEYVARVAAKFQDNGSGEVGDMSAVVNAIIMDAEARSPMEHLSTAHFGHLREPLIRTMHLARVMNMGRFPNLLWWDWGNYVADSLQDPMGAPSVFNYYRPDFSMRGQLAQNGLDSPVFGITDSYAAIAFPNRLWKITEQGFHTSNYSFPPDWSELSPLAGDIPTLLDRVSLLFCAGAMSARSRELIEVVLASTNDTIERCELAAYLALICPEGACLK